MNGVVVEPREVLPHRYPMLLVDRVVGVVPGDWATAVKVISRNEPWYADSGDRQAYPEVLLVESWAQTAGIAIGADSPNPDVLSGSVMLFGSLSTVEFHRRVLPGDVLEHRVRVVKAVGDTVIFEGECVRQGETVFTVSRMVVTFRPAGSLKSGAK
ncbi:3-hydroxyacyl-ACP dehydratase FabZ family protein [Umezawaea endophytica]|uniref:3-hydroxyacyl-ACP dehydratase n=1 Tax=Umezawaea endophytica TaxID=1654476 RepID=A0A9X2VVR6_9PSEU|nr:3-hydroxyacyl-ACP dehydratase [Umezawaea endophytica]MCS7483574.1 3-hydroxyacyl-ACP dehydratase [Umezawaea endophytica]